MTLNDRLTMVASGSADVYAPGPGEYVEAGRKRDELLLKYEQFWTGRCSVLLFWYVPGP